MFSLRSIIASRLKPVSETFNPYFVPLDLQSIKNTIDSVTEDPFNVKLGSSEPLRPRLESILQNISKFAQKVPHKIILQPGKVKVVNGPKDLRVSEILGKYTPAAVYYGAISDTNLLGLLYSDFNVAQSQLFDSFLNKELSKVIASSVVFSAGSTGTSVQNNESISIFKRLTKAFTNPVSINGEGISQGNPALHRRTALLQSIMTEYSRTEKFNTRADATITRELSGFVNSINAEIILVQAGDGGEQLVREKDALAKALLNQPVGGSSMLQSIKSFLTKVWYAGTNSKNEIVRRETEKPRKVKIIDRIKSIFAQSKTTINANTVDGTSIRGTATLVNLSSIEDYINKSLHDTIRDNMGVGMEEGILNYQTGRFARSAKVTATSMDKSGNINMFYTYMRHPYGTFASGGAQHIKGMPNRDPVYIIQESIRSLAKQKAIARLRTILV